MSVPNVPPRSPDGHKGTFGHVLVIAGSSAYPGAALLCTRAALRGGAGLSTLAHPASIRTIVGAHLLCEIAVALPDENGAFAAAAAARALELAEARSAVALGPGLTRSPGAEALAHQVATSSTRPLVLDADGLNAFEGRARDLRGASGPRIVTPHPGEAARLLGRGTAEIQADRAQAARDLAKITGAVVVLKGAGTVVADASDLHVNTTGNPGLATGGSGDVLTGLLAALLAQGMVPFEAAVLGVHLHGLAGDLAARELGTYGLVASDVLDHLPHAFVAHARTRTGG